MKYKVYIAIMVGLIGCALLINGFINEEGKQDVVVIDNTNKTTLITSSTNTTKTTKTSKATVKTTKKTIKKVKKFNIKYNRQEIIEDTTKEDKKIKRIQSNGETLYSEYIGEWLIHKERYTEYDELLMNKINEIIDKVNKL